MEDNATSISSAPADEPAAARRSGVGRWLSLLLIAGGLVLIGFGGWLSYRQYQELAHPPAPIVTVSLAELEATALPSPTDAPAVPAAIENTAEPAAQAAPATPEATPTPRPAETVTPTGQPAAAEAPTLADNPLVIAGESGGQPADTAAPEAVNSAKDSLPLARIVADSIKMDAAVVPVGWETIIQNTEEVTVWSVAANAAGWHNNTLLPGQGGNVVLSGHHNVDGEVFRYIVDLEPGAVVTLYNEAGEAFDYAVEDKFILKDKGEPDAVRQANARWIGPFNDERLTLVTCWPYTNNTHRVIVIAKPAGETQAMSQ